MSTVWPATTTPPVRAAFAAFAPPLTVNVAGPAPDAGLTANHGAVLTAVHAQPEGAPMSMVAAPPPTGRTCVDGPTVYAHPGTGGEGGAGVASWATV
jgi:hypothetical protein